MSERSLELLKQSVDNKIKYDYFIVGISAATFSYFAKDFTALPNVGFNESSFILLSLLLLSVSVISGLIKIERNNKGLEKNSRLLDFQERLACYKRNSFEGGVAINEYSGEILTPADSEISAAALESLMPKWKRELTFLGCFIRFLSVLRDSSLFLAYLSLAISKFLPTLAKVI